MARILKKANDYWKGKLREKSARWQGGKNVAWNGYVRVLKRDHPRALSNGYVWEHILVAEDKLGRHLKYFGKGDSRNETVHHLNHDKTDNRPENLEILSPSEHSKREWDEPSRYPQSKQTQIEDPERYDEWHEKNVKRFKN